MGRELFTGLDLMRLDAQARQVQAQVLAYYDHLGTVAGRLRSIAEKE